MTQTRSTVRYTLSLEGDSTVTELSGNVATSMLLSQDFRNAIITVVGINTPNLRVNFYTSNQNKLPSLSQPATDENQYTSSMVVDLESGTNIAGNEGVLMDSETIKEFEINQNGNRYIGAKVSNHTAGSVKIYIDLYDNN